jgi:preprotein translocase subunit SecA
MVEAARKHYLERVQRFGEAEFARLEKVLLLDTVDRQWKDHLLALDHQREGIGLRAYGQRDPLVEYKRESYVLFEEMWASIEDHVIKFLYHAEPVPEEQMRRRVQPVMSHHPEAAGFAESHRQRAGGEHPVGGPTRPATCRTSLGRCTIPAPAQKEVQALRGTPLRRGGSGMASDPPVGLTFDDVLLIPTRSDVHPNQVDVDAVDPRDPLQPPGSRRPQ